MMSGADLSGALQMYSQARRYVSEANLEEEVRWQRRVDFAKFTETDILREAAWVVLCSGFRESTIRKCFDHISLCYCDWESSAAILEAGPRCKLAAYPSFRNTAKLNAIIEIARRVHDVGFVNFKQAVSRDPISELMKLPFVGAVTAWHLAKNLGFNIAKPDRHVQRAALALGYEDAQVLCGTVARFTREQVRVVDLVIWRFLADNPTYRSGRAGSK